MNSYGDLSKRTEQSVVTQLAKSEKDSIEGQVLVSTFNSIM